MLQKIGKRTKTFFGILFFVPIIASFLVWGIGDMIKATGAPRYAATVGNVTIPVQALQSAYARQLDALRRQGMNINAEMAKSLGIVRQVLNNMIDRELLLKAARDSGIVIGDAAVAAEIQKEKGFADDKGKFSRDKFKSLLQNANVSEQEFVAGLREDMAIKILLGALQDSAVPPRDLPRAIYVLKKTLYQADIYALPHDAMEMAHTPTDAELKAYYDAHKDHYQRAEQRRMTVATLPLAGFAADTQPSEDDLKKVYAAHQSDLTIPEERSVQFVALPDEAKAKQVAELARGGEKLAAAASTVAGAPVALKNMENVAPGTLPADLDKALFKLPRGETSEPVNTPLGWYVMQITNIKAGAVIPMDRVHDKLAQLWRQDQVSEKLPDTLNKLDDGIAGGASLEELAKTFHLQLRELPMLDAAGRGGDEKISADKSLADVLATGFKQNQGEVGNVFERPNGDYAVVRVDEVRAAAVPPLADIRDQVTTDWRKAQQRELAENAVRKLANAWRGGDDVSAVADKSGAHLTSSGAISLEQVEKSTPPRGLQMSPIDRAILRAGAVGDVVTSTDGTTEYVAKIRTITPPAAVSITDAALTDSRTLATQWARNDYVQLFLNAVRKHTGVEVNDKAIAQIQSNAD